MIGELGEVVKGSGLELAEVASAGRSLGELAKGHEVSMSTIVRRGQRTDMERSKAGQDLGWKQARYPREAYQTCVEWVAGNYSMASRVTQERRDVTKCLHRGH